MTKQEFFSLCSAHDWYYSYSDDHGAWRRGAAEAATLQRLAREDLSLRPILESFAAWVNGDGPKPTSPSGT